jgi:hypothetical protein
MCTPSGTSGPAGCVVVFGIEHAQTCRRLVRCRTVTVIHVPTDRKEYARRFNLQGWIKGDPDLVAAFGSVVEAVKSAALKTSQDPEVVPKDKIVRALTILVKDCASLDAWIDAKSDTADVPVSDEEWAIFFESAAWMVYQAHEHQRRKEAGDGDQED